MCRFSLTSITLKEKEKERVSPREMEPGGKCFIPKTLNPFFAAPPPPSQCPSSSRRPFSDAASKEVSILKRPHRSKPSSVVLSLPQNITPICSDEIPSVCPWAVPNSRRAVRCLAGRSKKKADSPVRLSGDPEVLRQFKRTGRRRSKKLAESFFNRLKNPHQNHPDNFTEDELQAIGLGYDRMVRFMEQDDPNLKHPYDWYKYGEFGPFSWRGIVIGDPIRGKFTDERVSIMGEVRDHEEWEKIEQFDLISEYGKRVSQFDTNKGIRYFWIFVRHPKWRLSDLPWRQWTLVAEVAIEAGKNQRLDKWSLMGRLGNTARRLITKCAAWMRPDIIYVKRPVYQCRFEPQEDFLSALVPLLDPNTEQDYYFELEDDDGRVELCTYFGGLCKIAKANPKAFVDDVVDAYEKLSDEKKSKCLQFLLTNHPVKLLHPYTKEWKAKLEEMELGCDAPDDGGGGGGDYRVDLGESEENEILDWAEDEGDISEDRNDEDDEEYDGASEDEDEDEDFPVDVDDLDDDMDTGEDIPNWRDEIERSKSSGEAIEQLAKRSIELTSNLYDRHLRDMEAQSKTENAAPGSDQRAFEDGDESFLRGKRAKVNPEEWKYAGIGRWNRRVRRSKIPSDVFLRAAVKPFTYRNLVKEIVLTRHAILDGDIGSMA